MLWSPELTVQHTSALHDFAQAPELALIAVTQATAIGLGEHESKFLILIVITDNFDLID